MRKTAFIVILSLITGVLFAQNIDDPQILTQLLNKLELTEKEIEKAVEIQREANNVKREMTLELNLIQAQLEKLLYPVEVDLKEVEALLRASLEFKLKAELAEIKRRVEWRKLLGEEKWERLLWMFMTRRRASQEAQEEKSRPQN